MIPRTLVSLVLVLAGVAAPVACDDGSSASTTDYAPMLRGVADGVAVPENASFASSADALVTATRALESAPDQGSLDKAQGAWRDARAAWRKLDALHFGPIADLALGERIDVSANAGAIDAIVSGTATIDVASVSAAAGNTKGFLGLEYLVFSSNGDALARLQGDGAPARRRTLARAIAEEIAQTAHQLDDAWAAGKGGFAAEVSGAGAGSHRYATQRAAVDDVVGSVGFALELVAGVRLGQPLGKKSGTPDPTLDPTRGSDNAAADVAATLAGVQAVYQADGFAARVKDKSAALDARVTSELADCSAKVAAIPKPFATAVTASTAAVAAAYDACKALKTTWNTDVTSALGATLKPSDNDGD